MSASADRQKAARKAKFLGPIRLEEDLLAKVAELAERNDRSMAAEVRRALRRHVESELEGSRAA